MAGVIFVGMLCFNASIGKLQWQVKEDQYRIQEINIILNKIEERQLSEDLLIASQQEGQSNEEISPIQEIPIICVKHEEIMPACLKGRK